MALELKDTAVSTSFWNISAMEAAQMKLAHSSCWANSAIATTLGSLPAHSSLPRGCFLRRLVATPTLFCSPPNHCQQATIRCVVLGDFLAFCPLRAELWVVPVWVVGSGVSVEGEMCLVFWVLDVFILVWVFCSYEMGFWDVTNFG